METHAEDGFGTQIIEENGEIYRKRASSSSTEDDLGKLKYNHSQARTFPSLVPHSLPDSIRPPIPAPSRSRRSAT
jgi:hypothetical protein